MNSIIHAKTKNPVLCMIVDGERRCSEICLTPCAAHYGTTVMERVAVTRGYPVQPCMFASPYLSIGTWAIITSHVNGRSEKCQVMDEPQPHHWNWITRRGIVAELNWSAARRLCNLEYVGQSPPVDCPVTVSPIVIQKKGNKSAEANTTLPSPILWYRLIKME